jgi:two-component system phosphate regulon sensor histidine kinase PhoR
MWGGIRTFFLALLPALIGGGVAVLSGAHWLAALLAVLGGATAVSLAIAERQRRMPLEIPEPALSDGTKLTPAALLTGIDDPILLIEQGRVALANPAARALLGDHILAQDVRLAVRHPGAAARLADPTDGLPVELVGLGARERVWEMSVRQVAPGLRLVRLADRSTVRAAELMRVDFVANASHELRTPLATIIGFIETLEDAGDDAAVRARFLGIMAAEARRMQRLVEDLMSLSRIEADKHRAPADLVAVGSLVAEAVAVVESTDPNGAGRIQVQIPQGLPPAAGDRGQLLQLLHNLIGNALKYGRSDGKVQIQLDHEDEMLRLRIADEGDGIAPEHLPRLTERFYRVDPSRSRGIGGTGLGLSIVKHIVERHRGRLDIVSEAGVGTTVTVLLPPAPTEPATRVSAG